MDQFAVGGSVAEKKRDTCFHSIKHRPKSKRLLLRFTLKRLRITFRTLFSFLARRRSSSLTAVVVGRRVYAARRR